MSRYYGLMNAIANSSSYPIDSSRPDPVEVCALMLVNRISLETFGVLSQRANMSNEMIDKLFMWKDATSTIGIEDDNCILAALLIVATAKKNIQLIVLLLPSLLTSAAFQDIGPLLPENILMYIVFMRNRTLADNMRDKVIGINILRTDDYVKNVLMIMEKHIGRKDYLTLFEMVDSDFSRVSELPQDLIDIYLQYVAYTMDAEEFIRVVNGTTGTGLNYDINFCPDPYLIIFKSQPDDLFKMLRTFISMKVIVVSNGYVYWNFNTLICNMILKTIDKIDVSNINLVPRTNGQEELKTMIEKYKILNTGRVTTDISLLFSEPGDNKLTEKDIDEIFNPVFEPQGLINYGADYNVDSAADYSTTDYNDTNIIVNIPEPRPVIVATQKKKAIVITDLTRKTGIRARRDAKRRNMRK